MNAASRSWSWVVAAGAALTLAACADHQPTAPSRAAAPSFDQRRGDGSNELHPASQQHGDDGQHEAWGRSGTTVISALALIDKGGVTDLAVTSFAASDTTVPAGSISKVLVFASSGVRGDDGFLIKTFDDLRVGSRFTTRLGGLVPGAKLRILALVRGTGGRRTDVVTDMVVVVKGPDLSVTSVTGASQGMAGIPVFVTAGVTELNGQVGARADCNLYDGTIKADSIPNIWVDAGGTVNCAFAPAFSVAALKTLVVRVENVRPRDYDPGNNSGTFTVAIATAGTAPGGPTATQPAAFTFNATVLDEAGTYYDSTWAYDYDATGVPTDSVFADTTSSGRTQQSEFHGIIYTAVPFPLTQWALGQSSMGVSLDSLRVASVAPDPGGAVGATCVSRLAPGVLRQLCSYAPDNIFPIGHTTVDYVRFAGLVTYESKQFTYTYGAGGGGCVDPTTCWANNAVNQQTGTLAAWGSTMTFTARVTAGGFDYSAVVTLPLTTTSVNTQTPKTCGTTSIVQFGQLVGSHTFCESTRTNQTIIGGTQRGAGLTVLAP